MRHLLIVIRIVYLINIFNIVACVGLE